MVDNIPIITAKGVNKRFGNTRILDDVSFQVRKGGIFGIVGPSGSGKTTLLKVIVDFYKPDSGHMNVDVKRVRDKVGFTTQNNCFYDALTVNENLIYFGSLYGMKKSLLKERSKQLLTTVGLAGHGKKLALKLSGGMSRRLDLAISLLNNPDILILDELTAGLDPIARKQMIALVRNINNSGVTVLISTHMLDEIEELCDDMILLSNGKIIAQGHPDTLKQDFMKYEQVIIQTYPGNYKNILSHIAGFKHDISHYHIENNKLILLSGKASKVIHQILYSLNGCKEKLIEIDISKPDLNVVFEKAAGGKE
jgi:ABC-2 type transport system ATP-binding protein